MGKKITDYTNNVSVTPDDASLLDLSEKIGVSSFESRKWALSAFKTWVNSWVVAGAVAWADITGKPTTLSGYGITDAVQSNTAITGATKTKITYDSKGLVTLGEDLIASDIPDLDWAKITTGKPTTLAGYGITDAIDGSGTANYVAKFSDANTLTDSQIRDNGTSVSINSAPSASVKLNISSNNSVGIASAMTVQGTGIDSRSQTSGSLSNFGSVIFASNSTTQNVGIESNATGGTTSTNIGITSYASGGTSNYCIKLQDGTEGTGKILKSVSAQGLANWANFPCEIQLAVSDETTALTTGTGKITFRMPYAMTVTEVRASLTTAGTTSGLTTIDINENGVSILSTKLTIDLTETTSTTATTPAVISDTALADDAEITVDIDAISGGATEKGLKILIKGYRAI